MKPDASRYNPDPAYLRELIAKTGMTQADVARKIGIGGRVIRCYLANPAATTYQPVPYPVQYAIEMLATTTTPAE